MTFIKPIETLSNGYIIDYYTNIFSVDYNNNLCNHVSGSFAGMLQRHLAFTACLYTQAVHFRFF